jgi:di/tricarboxylate transporter
MEAVKHVFAAMWTPVIMLLLGGFTIAAALSKYDIAKLMATFVLSRAGTKPRTVLLTNMFVAMIASMWISNVAAPVLCFSIIQVLSRTYSGAQKLMFPASASKSSLWFKLLQISRFRHCAGF